MQVPQNRYGSRSFDAQSFEDSKIPCGISEITMAMPLFILIYFSLTFIILPNYIGKA